VVTTVSTGADPEGVARGGEWRRLGPRSRVERRRRDDRGVKGAEGMCCGEEVSPSPRGRMWEWGCAPFPENCWIFELKKASFGAFWD